MKNGWTTHSSNNAIWLALSPCHMTMTCKINKLEKPGGQFLIPYLADLLPFMVNFERTLWRQSGPPGYHHQTYPWMCITYVTYRTLCNAIVYQELPNQPSPRKAENFPRGERNFKHVPLLKNLMYFSPKVLYMVGPICVLESPHRPFISISRLLSQLFKSSICW